MVRTTRQVLKWKFAQTVSLSVVVVVIVDGVVVVCVVAVVVVASKIFALLYELATYSKNTNQESLIGIIFDHRR